MVVERVRSTKFLGVKISDDLTWPLNINSAAKKTQRCLHFLRRQEVEAVYEKRHIVLVYMNMEMTNKLNCILTHCLLHMNMPRFV